MPLLGERLSFWPESRPLICFQGQGSRFEILPISFTEIPFSEFAEKTLMSRPALFNPHCPFQTGFVGLLPYDGQKPRVYRVTRALVSDLHRGTTTLCQEPGALEGNLGLTESELDQFLSHRVPTRHNHHANFTWKSLEEDGVYISKVKSCIEDIRSGRYYQINLLRYYQLRGSLTMAHWRSLLASRGGSFSCLFEFPDYRLVSFSPERFVQIIPIDDELQISAFPIKGTAARDDDPAKDQENKARLSESSKDLAELHMIVDLMRNDLARVANPGTVEVVSSHLGVTHKYVHHLQAEVRAYLKPDLKLSSLINAVCPGGSITGAPKIEVMAAIQEYEGRQRNFFMGNAFVSDLSGYFDSSILIRTACALKKTPTSDFCWEFAAGSGIVIKSDPQTEKLEVDAKLRVVLP
jgi:para-aminobenzoate synthetase component I